MSAPNARPLLLPCYTVSADAARDGAPSRGVHPCTTLANPAPTQSSSGVAGQGSMDAKRAAGCKTALDLIASQNPMLPMHPVFQEVLNSPNLKGTLFVPTARAWCAAAASAAQRSAAGDTPGSAGSGEPCALAPASAVSSSSFPRQVDSSGHRSPRVTLMRLPCTPPTAAAAPRPQGELFCDRAPAQRQPRGARHGHSLRPGAGEAQLPAAGGRCGRGGGSTAGRRTGEAGVRNHSQQLHSPVGHSKVSTATAAPLG